MRVFSLTPVLLACAASVVVAPKPKAPGNLALSFTSTATTLTVKGCWTASGAPDGFATTAGVTGQVSQAHPSLGVVACDSFTFAAPAPGVTVTAAFGVSSKRRGKISTETSTTKNYTEPDVPPPPPVIDSLKLTPASVTVTPGSSVQFSAQVFGS